MTSFGVRMIRPRRSFATHRCMHVIDLGRYEELFPTMNRSMSSRCRRLLVLLAAARVISSSAFVVSVPQSGERRIQASSGTRLFAADDDADYYDYFAPLLSPHAYPDGISPDHKPESNQDTSASDSSFDEYSPLRLNNLEFTKRPSSEAQEDRPAVDTDVVFDPTLSPHEYASGTPDIVVGDKGTVYKESSGKDVRRVGILLMDHGSRNDDSNQRLQDLAKLYEKNVRSSSPSCHVIVRAAHMEIAAPSIHDGIHALMKASVDEIVCHPYFLSPAGRHVVDDIPRIVQAAIDELEVDIPVLTTDPVGADAQVMIGAIHSLVLETSNLLATGRSRN